MPAHLVHCVKKLPPPPLRIGPSLESHRLEHLRHVLSSRTHAERGINTGPDSRNPHRIFLEISIKEDERVENFFVRHLFEVDAEPQQRNRLVRFVEMADPARVFKSLGLPGGVERRSR